MNSPTDAFSCIFFQFHEPPATPRQRLVQERNEVFFNVKKLDVDTTNGYLDESWGCIILRGLGGSLCGGSRQRFAGYSCSFLALLTQTEVKVHFDVT